jgi:fatty-acid desaturase
MRQSALYSFPKAIYDTNIKFIFMIGFLNAYNIFILSFLWINECFVFLIYTQTGKINSIAHTDRLNSHVQ